MKSTVIVIVVSAVIVMGAGAGIVLYKFTSVLGGPNKAISIVKARYAAEVRGRVEKLKFPLILKGWLATKDKADPNAYLVGYIYELPKNRDIYGWYWEVNLKEHIIRGVSNSPLLAKKWGIDFNKKSYILGLPRAIYLNPEDPRRTDFHLRITHEERPRLRLDLPRRYPQPDAMLLELEVHDARRKITRNQRIELSGLRFQIASIDEIIELEIPDTDATKAHRYCVRFFEDIKGSWASIYGGLSCYSFKANYTSQPKAR